MRKNIFNYLIFRVIGVICGNKHPARRKQFAAKACAERSQRVASTDNRNPCVLCASARKQDLEHPAYERQA
jgi:hypothetical protein